MFNQCTPGFASGFAGQFPFGGFQPFNWNGFNPQSWQGQNWFNQPWNFQNWNGQNWSNGFNGFQGQSFDWNAFYAGCCCGYQNACNTFASQGENTNGQNNPQFNSQYAGPFNGNGFGFFPYGPFPFNFNNTQNACPPNQQAA